MPLDTLSASGRLATGLLLVGRHGVQDVSMKYLFTALERCASHEQDQGAEEDGHARCMDGSMRSEAKRHILTVDKPLSNVKHAKTPQVRIRGIRYFSAVCGCHETMVESGTVQLCVHAITRWWNPILLSCVPMP